MYTSRGNQRQLSKVSEAPSLRKPQQRSFEQQNLREATSAQQPGAKQPERSSFIGAISATQLSAKQPPAKQADRNSLGQQRERSSLKQNNFSKTP